MLLVKNGESSLISFHPANCLWKNYQPLQFLSLFSLGMDILCGVWLSYSKCVPILMVSVEFGIPCIIWQLFGTCLLATVREKRITLVSIIKPSEILTAFSAFISDESLHANDRLTKGTSLILIVIKTKKFTNLLTIHSWNNI